jgi:hypothetical protein
LNTTVFVPCHVPISYGQNCVFPLQRSSAGACEIACPLPVFTTRQYDALIWFLYIIPPISFLWGVHVTVHTLRTRHIGIISASHSRCQSANRMDGV